MAHQIVDAIADKKGENIVLLDIQALSTIADYFVIASGTSERQLKALTEGVSETVRENLKVKPRHIEGDPSTGWVLLDYADVIVHLFSPRLRAYYDLESLWKSAPVLVRMQ